MPQDKTANADNIEHQRLTSLVNSMADGVIAVDSAGKIALYNGAALNILDNNSSMQGKPLDSVLKPIDKDNQPVDVYELIQNTKTSTFSRDYRLAYSDGSLINLYLSIAPVHLGYGKDNEHGYVLLIRDITREKSLEEERDEFISVVSHELRTPIAIAEGNISNAQFIVGKKAPDPVILKALDEAHKQTLFLSGMINDLSTLSRAERDKLSYEVEAINAHDLVLELVANYQPSAAQKGLKIIADVDDHLELLHSGRLYVQEILQNFITNAIKYTEKGTVTLGAKPTAKGVVFSITDSGIGISKSDQQKVFDKFFRSEDYRTRANNGTGLGLYVTIKLVRLLHGEVEVESELNVGSTFKVTFPNLK
ncbi:MAG: hypothetical protein JWM37_381 [Candidatus Saccharibacteria bacterium]|nr:hypothetical protein [Candidatus Saccharibacteria bacterium]